MLKPRTNELITQIATELAGSTTDYLIKQRAVSPFADPIMQLAAELAYELRLRRQPCQRAKNRLAALSFPEQLAVARRVSDAVTGRRDGKKPK